MNDKLQALLALWDVQMLDLEMQKALYELDQKIIELRKEIKDAKVIEIE